MVCELKGGGWRRVMRSVSVIVSGSVGVSECERWRR